MQGLKAQAAPSAEIKPVGSGCVWSEHRLDEGGCVRRGEPAECLTCCSASIKKAGPGADNGPRVPLLLAPGPRSAVISAAACRPGD